jgi:hypothetical protein
MKDEHGDWWWEPEGGAYETFDKAHGWYEKYKAGGYDVRIVETKILKAWENGKEYK